MCDEFEPSTASQGCAFAYRLASRTEARELDWENESEVQGTWKHEKLHLHIPTQAHTY